MPNSIKQEMNTSLVKKLALLGFFCFLSFGTSFARVAFASVAYQQLHFANLKPESQLRNIGCQLCHTRAKGGAPWNSFGQAVGYWRGQKQDIGQAMYSAIWLGNDADHDTYPDALELFAGTNPRDKNSKPTETISSLQKEFEQNKEATKYLPDNDDDGFPDALEILAGTLPGDSNSKPTQNPDGSTNTFVKDLIASLQSDLKTVGGLEYFAPKK